MKDNFYFQFFCFCLQQDVKKYINSRTYLIANTFSILNYRSRRDWMRNVSGMFLASHLETNRIKKLQRIDRNRGYLVFATALYYTLSIYISFSKNSESISPSASFQMNKSMLRFHIHQ